MPPLDVARTDMVNKNSCEDSEGSIAIVNPGKHDVLLGRGGGTNNHIGNVNFRKLVNEHKMRYLACSKVDKPKVAREVVAIWREMDPPGRFLTRKDDTRRGPGSIRSDETEWIEVGDKKAREKASQCLRERTADVLPYIKQLREQQDAETEHGVSAVSQKLKKMDGNATEDTSARTSYSTPHQGLSRSDTTSSYVMRNNMAPMMTSSQQGHYMPYQRTISYGGSDFAYPIPSASQDEHASNIREMSEVEYQQRMYYMQQQLQMQQMQLMRMQQQRALLQHQSAGYDHPESMRGAVVSTGSNSDYTPFAETSASARAPKRTLSNTAKHVTPDRLPSSNGSISAMGGGAMEGEGELTLEEYRQQLENYLASNQVDNGLESDLEEDEWQKERRASYKQQIRSPRRGVGRNPSGMSMMSLKSTGSGMSVISGISGMSGLSDVLDLSNGSRRQVDRNISGDLSLMSQLTDLSQNIDTLSLYDEL